MTASVPGKLLLIILGVDFRACEYVPSHLNKD